MTCTLDAWTSVFRPPRRDSPVLFLDRDGTVIENRPYLADPDGVNVIPGARETIADFRAAGYAIIMVTNQSGVARGLFGPEQYRAVEIRVVEALGADMIDVIYACPFHPDGKPPFAGEHAWRKPAPGMLLDAASRFGVDLNRSIMIGDSLCDIEAGANAGLPWLIHTLTGHGTTERPAVEAFSAKLREISHRSAVHCVQNIGDLSTDDFQW